MTDAKRPKIKVVVNGTPVKVRADVPARIVAKALRKSGNYREGFGIQGWELRDAEGRVVTMDDDATAGLAKGSMLFLNLRAGVGGSLRGKLRDAAIMDDAAFDAAFVQHKHGVLNPAARMRHDAFELGTYMQKAGFSRFSTQLEDGNEVVVIVGQEGDGDLPHQ